MFSLLPTPVPTCSSCHIVRSLLRVLQKLYLPCPGLKLLYLHLCPAPAQPPACLPVRPSPRRRPLCGQKEVSTQHARCWIGCYFSRSTGPNPAQGVGGSGDRTCRAGARGQNFPVFYPFATWSPIERNGSLRANRRGWPGSGPPARPQESCPLWRGEGKL